MKRITEGMEVAVPGYTVVRLNLVEDINSGVQLSLYCATFFAPVVICQGDLHTLA